MIEILNNFFNRKMGDFNSLLRFYPCKCGGRFNSLNSFWVHFEMEEKR